MDQGLPKREKERKGNFRLVGKDTEQQGDVGDQCSESLGCKVKGIPGRW